MRKKDDLYTERKLVKLSKKLVKKLEKDANAQGLFLSTLIRVIITKYYENKTANSN